MKIGSQGHRDAFCAHFMQTYIEYDPKALPWPELDEAALRRSHGRYFMPVRDLIARMQANG